MSRSGGQFGAWNHLWFIGAICLGLVLSADRTTAGQEAAASIIGRVIDEGGGVLPGVTVTATSPALQVAGVTGVTDTQGEYRLTPLPVGVYAIEYALSGFQAIRQQGIRLTVGFTAKLDVTLKVGGIEETLTVHENARRKRRAPTGIVRWNGRSRFSRSHEEYKGTRRP